MFTELFDKDLEEISQELSRIDDKNNLLDSAVVAWCNKLQLTPNETTDIREWIKVLKSKQSDSENNLFSVLGNIFSLENTISSSLELIKYINVKMFLVAVAALIGLGYLLLRSNARKKEESKLINSQPIYTLPHSQDNKKNSWILVLIINAGNTSIIQDFKSNSKVTLNEAEELYHSTRALWMDTQTNFWQSELEKRVDVDEEQALTEEEESEYDVYFVQLELKEHHIGFEPNAKSIDKSDAFKMLPEIAIKVKASPRLSSKSYENTGVYLL
ncbi:MAG: hypothetical protein DSM106950_42005 [Stigonema ocellatum SAG 48.90 = DSM 106950]|nr:hypothetical protein [Stigonema ocellatum SAG 48.90 = DSM 106950]